MTRDTVQERERMIDLEIRYTHQAAMLDELSDIVRDQADQLATLKREVQRLTAVLEALDAPQHEPPPHY